MVWGKELPFQLELAKTATLESEEESRVRQRFSSSSTISSNSRREEMSPSIARMQQKAKEIKSTSSSRSSSSCSSSSTAASKVVQKSTGSNNTTFKQTTDNLAARSSTSHSTTSTSSSSSSRRYRTSASLYMTSSGSASAKSASLTTTGIPSVTATAGEQSLNMFAMQANSSQSCEQQSQQNNNQPIEVGAMQQVESREIFISPDVRSINDEIGNEFKRLQSWVVDDMKVSSSSSYQQKCVSSLSSRLFGRSRLLSPLRTSVSGNSPLAITAGDDESNEQISGFKSPQSASVGLSSSERRLKFDNWPEAASSSGGLNPSDKHEFSWNQDKSKSYFELSPSESATHRFDGEKVKELLSKAQSHTSRHFGLKSAHSGFDECDAKTDRNNNNNSSSNRKSSITTTIVRTGRSPNRGQSSTLEPQSALANCDSGEQRRKKLSINLAGTDRTSAAINESIKKIDHRMSDLCKKLNECNDTKKVIELLKVMIQMIEKAWSVPLCGDDFGFRLCNSLRLSGGLDFILTLIHVAHESQISIFTDSFSDDFEDENLISDSNDERSKTKPVNKGNKGLRLNLAKLDHNHKVHLVDRQQDEDSGLEGSREAKDSDSETLQTSYLDSTSIESSASSNHEIARPQEVEEGNPTETSNQDSNETIKESAQDESAERDESQDPEQVTCQGNADGEDDPRKEELIFLCARLLSQSLTSDNRDYLVKSGLKPVVKLACHFTTMKSSQTHRQLSAFSIQTRPMLTRQNSAISKANSPTSGKKTSTTVSPSNIQQQPSKEITSLDSTDSETDRAKLDSVIKNQNQQEETDFENDLLATIGTEILQHLFKHSEDACSTIIALGGLEAILYGCRSSNVEILRHCASALANLALYGGPDSQQMMIEHKAHVWLFPLAFNEDDNIQYYACLAIVILLANQEIEADVLKSSTLDLVEPFVTSHEPRKFAESTTAHIHGQSAAWLRKLIPLLESKREAARNLAAFHFAMEAYIKKEQGQVSLFKDIGAIEPLKRLGSSPIANASKFACQALRLIGEKEPHKLSQQVPLWTSEDVLEWVSQLIGFEPYREKFKESGVDGDLLLQLDEQMLEFDIGIQNGIVRRRFLRELSQLKHIADYSSLDKSGLCSLLGRDNIQYAYQMLLFGVTKDNIHQLDGEQLLNECKVTNIIHRLRLAQTIKQLQERIAREEASEGENGTDGGNQKTLDVFVSYRRSNGSQLASLLKVHLQLRGFSVFIDVERLEAGKFDNNLLDSINSAKNFILVLSPNALDRCIGDVECKDWVHKEIVAALASDCNIIPIMDNFHWPEPEQLPEDMRSISNFNGVRWIHDYQDACVNKIERFIRGELMNTVRPASQACGGGGSASAGASCGPGGGSLQRLASGICSTSQYAGSTPASSVYSARATPFGDLDHHPLSSYATSANNTSS